MSLIQPKVELWYDGQWNDETALDRVRTEAGGGGITIERSDRDPDTAQVTFDNTGGRYSPRKPDSPLYGKLGRNTPIRISVPALGGTAQYRFTGKVTAWPPRWDPSESNAWVTVDCAGERHRLTQGRKPLQSALRRDIPTTDPISYWHLEDPEGSAEAENVIAGGTPMRLFGASRFTIPGSGGLPQPAAGLPVFASGGGVHGSGPIIDLSQGGVLWAPVPQDPAVTGWRIEWVMVCPRDQENTRIPIWWETTDDYDDHPPPAGGTQTMRYEFQIESGGVFAFYGRDLTTYGTMTASFTIFDGLPHHYQIDGSTVTGDIAVYLYIDGTLVAAMSSLADTIAGTAGQITEVVVNPLETENGDASMPVIGHVAVYAGVPSPATETYLAATGWAGETAGARFTRMTAEESIDAAVSGTSSITQPMGPQRQRTILELLRECADADDGHLYEGRSGNLVLRTGRDLVTRALDPIEVPYTSILPPLAPREDDQGIRNDVTVTRPGGGSYRAVQTAGPLNTGDPDTDPDAVGTYDVDVEVNVEQDFQLRGAAGLRLSVGTHDEARYGSVRVDLADVPALADANPGYFVTLTGLPVFLPPDDTLQRIRSWTETIDVVQHVLDLDLIPGEPYRAGVLGTTTRVSPTLSETTAAFVSGTDTSMTVARDDTSTRLWITTADRSQDFPFDIMAAGVRLTVTGITGASDPQTMTITKTPVNGVIKTIPSGSAVTLAEPWRLAR